MAAWRTVQLSEVCNIQRGASPRPIDNFITEDNSGINWIKIGDVAEGTKYITSTKEKISPEGALHSRAVQIGDFLLSNSMSFGRPYILRTSGCIHDGWLLLRYDPAQLSEDYLYHVLSSDFVYAQFKKFAVGAVVKNLNSEVVRKVAIPLPPIAEQRRIAAILDNADVLRVKRRETLAQLDELQQSIFIEMFGDPVRGNGEHVVQPLESIASSEKYSIVDGPFGSSIKSSDYREYGVPVIRIANITKDGEFTDKNLLYIEEGLFEKLIRSSIQPGDVLVSRVGTLGNTCVFPDRVGKALLSTTGVCKITVNKSRMLPEFLHQAIMQSSFQEQIDKSASTSVQKYFNLSALRGWSIVVPPVDVQNAFVTKLSGIGLQRKYLKSSLVELNSLFSVLQHRAFGGEL